MLSTHGGDFLPEADHVLAPCKDGRVADGDALAHLSRASEYIQSMAVRDSQIAAHDGAREVNRVSTSRNLEAGAIGGGFGGHDTTPGRCFHLQIHVRLYWTLASPPLLRAHFVFDDRQGQRIVARSLVRTVMAAQASLFSSVDSVITINRFSQDVVLIDGDLLMALMETVSAGLVALAQWRW